MENKDGQFDAEMMRRAIGLSREGMERNAGGPFGAVVVKDGKIVAEGYNQVTSTNDPTAHAEVVAIRKASEALGNFELKGCVLYTSCEPCPMCLGAIYWARFDRVYYGCSHEDAREAGFDDSFIYSETPMPNEEKQIVLVQKQRDEAEQVFEEWKKKEDRKNY